MGTRSADHDRAYTSGATATAGTHQEKIMGKARESNKEAKKAPTRTPKEQKADKQLRKHETDATPIIPR